MTTKQQTFDAVCTHLAHLASLGLKSMYRGKCRYRANVEGWSLRCAVGCLIPDADYTPKLEDNTAQSPVVSKILNRYGHDLFLLADLQWLHDMYRIGTWADHLTDIARHHKLNPAYIKKVRQAEKPWEGRVVGDA